MEKNYSEEESGWSRKDAVRGRRVSGHGREVRDEPGRKSGNDSKNIQNDFLQIKFPSKQICPKSIWQRLKLILSMKYI